MDAPTFIVGIVDAIAWPAIILVLALLFRRELGPLIANLRKFSWGDKIVEFDKRLAAAESEAKELSDEVPVALPPPNDTGENQFEATLEISPELAIVQSWMPVECRLLALATKHGYVAGRARSISYILRRLESDGVLDKRTARIIDELRELRNLALHSPATRSISVQEARRYAELTDTVIDVLKQAQTR